MPDPALDPHAILAALGVAEGVTSVTPATGGWDTAIWRVERGTATYALRVFRPGQGHVARREAAVMRAPVPGVPIPAVHAAGSWQDRPALLIDWCAGRPLLEALRAEPRRAWALARHFGATQARLHAAAAPPALVAEGRSWVDWAGPDLGPLGDHLRALPPAPPRILHFDYHPLNVLVAGGRVTGVIDWANVHVGDRRADVARTLTILRLFPFGTGPGALAQRLGARFLATGWRLGYRAVAGPLRGMAPFYAWAGAAMLRDLAPRVDRPGGWLTAAHMEPIRRWTARWGERSRES